MGTPLNLLLIEDSENDALFIERELRRGGYDVTSERVQTASALAAAFSHQAWDLVTCDCAMPTLHGQDALAMLLDHDIQAPVIMVSGMAETEAAVAAMKAGAYDVVSKQKLAALCPVVKVALRAAAVRRELQRKEQALQSSELRYRRLFESAKDGILILEADTGKIIDVNPFLTELLGYRRRELVGRELWEISPFNDVVANQEAFRNLKKRQYLRYQNLPLQAKDGSRIDVEFVSNVYREHGTSVIQCNIRTTPHHTESVIRKLDRRVEEEVQARTAYLDAANKDLEAFNYSVSHDLRAPLRHIAGFSKLLLEEYSEQLDGRGQDYVRSMWRSTERMQQLIEDLIGLSHVTREEILWEPVPLSDLAQTLAALCRRADRSRQVDWIIAPGVVARGNTRLLRIVLENLIEQRLEVYQSASHGTDRIRNHRARRPGGVLRTRRRGRFRHGVRDQTLPALRTPARRVGLRRNRHRLGDGATHCVASPGPSVGGGCRRARRHHLFYARRPAAP